jgi:hypothetical protein
VIAPFDIIEANISFNIQYTFFLAQPHPENRNKSSSMFTLAVEILMKKSPSKLMMKGTRIFYV